MSPQITCFAVPLSKQFPACHADPVQFQSAPSTSGHTSSILPLSRRCLLALLCGRSADIPCNVTSTTASGPVPTSPACGSQLRLPAISAAIPSETQNSPFSSATKFSGKPAPHAVHVCASSNTSLQGSPNLPLGARSASRCLLTS